MFNILKKIFHILNSISVSAPGYILFLSMSDFVIWKIARQNLCRIHYWLLKTIDTQRYSNIANCLGGFSEKNVVIETNYASIILACYNNFNKNLDGIKVVLQARTSHRTRGCFPCVIIMSSLTSTYVSFFFYNILQFYWPNRYWLSHYGLIEFVISLLLLFTNLKLVFVGKNIFRLVHRRRR